MNSIGTPCVIPPPAVSPAVRQVDVQRLLAGAQEIRLVHHGVEYRLRVTRQGKLILTK